ncbi:2-(1,2-epoxy-1,2-dihydrophenyl)acetyl-CoA isomerase PaaG [soil metagenome]
MTYSTIKHELQDGLVTITLNRPQRLNAFNTEMHAELRDALDDADHDDAVRCMLLTGSGRGFCAGQDLSDRAVQPGEAAPDLGESIEQNYNPLIRRLTKLEMPVLCAVNGVAAGAGANLAFACDIVLAARSAKFIQAFCKIGLIPDTGGTWHLPRLAGHARAMGMALLGEAVDAETAERWGLIWKCLDDDSLLNEATRLGRHLATQPTAGLALIKRAMRASWSNELQAQLELEKELQRRAGRSEDYREGVQAFLEKRAPRFTGR